MGLEFAGKGDTVIGGEGLLPVRDLGIEIRGSGRWEWLAGFDQGLGNGMRVCVSVVCSSSSSLADPDQKLLFAPAFEGSYAAMFLKSLQNL